MIGLSSEAPSCGVADTCHHIWNLGFFGRRRSKWSRSVSAYAGVKENGVVCVNVLSARHERLSRLFGGGISFYERFAAAAWSTLQTGAPVLADCAVALSIAASSTSPMWTRMTSCFAQWGHCGDRTARTI
jgi:hypothetical protein